MNNFENRFYDSNGIGRNIRETADIDIQATLFTEGDSLFMYTNYTTKCSLLHERFLCFEIM